MNDDLNRAPRSAAWLAALLPLALLAVYLAERLTSDTPWHDPRRSVLSFGLVEADVLVRFGAAVPWRIGQGEWQRFVLEAFVAQSLLSLVLGVLFVRSACKQGAALFGAGATLAIFLVGSAAGAAGDAWARPGARDPLALGWFGAVLAMTGAFLAMGLFSGAHPARVPVRRAAVGSLVFLAVLHIGLTWPLREGAGLSAPSGDAALLASVLAGLVVGLLLRPWRPAVATGLVGKGLGVLAVGILAAAVAAQVARAAAEATQPGARTTLRDLRRLEVDARRVWEDGPRATSSAREALAEKRNALRGAMEVHVPEAIRPALDEYLALFEPLIQGDVPDPGGVRARLKMAAGAWYTAEDGWRRDVGLPAREPYDRRTWESR